MISFLVALLKMFSFPKHSLTILSSVNLWSSFILYCQLLVLHIEFSLWKNWAFTSAVCQVMWLLPAEALWEQQLQLSHPSLLTSLTVFSLCYWHNQLVCTCVGTATCARLLHSCRTQHRGPIEPGKSDFIHLLIDNLTEIEIKTHFSFNIW